MCFPNSALTALPGLPPGRWPTLVDGEQREMCCAGCQAVAQAIVAAGLDDASLWLKNVLG